MIGVENAGVKFKLAFSQKKSVHTKKIGDQNFLKQRYSEKSVQIILGWKELTKSKLLFPERRSRKCETDKPFRTLVFAGQLLPGS